MMATSAHAGLENYKLFRLPASTGNEFTNAVGDTRQFVPTSINNSGLLAGTRLTWTPDGNGGVVQMKGQASYIYDLNTRSFVADYIKLMAITHIGDTHYIGKRLHPNGKRWQTYRCPISGLVQDASGNWENPSCVLINNDYLDQNFSSGDWAGLFLFVNNLFKPAGGELISSNELSSSIVMDFDDDMINNDGIGIYYRADGSQITYTDSHAFLTQAFGKPTYESNLALQTSEGTSDIFVATYPVDNVTQTPAQVSFLTYPAGISVPDVQHIDIDWIDSATGQLVEVYGVNASGNVLTSAGVCRIDKIAGTCADQTAIDYLSVASRIGNDAAKMGAAIANDEIIVAKSCTEANDPDCSGTIYFYEIDDDLVVNLSTAIATKFSENLSPMTATYEYPTFLAVTSVNAVPAGMISSRNGLYHVLVSRDTSGVLRRYMISFN